MDPNTMFESLCKAARTEADLELWRRAYEAALEAHGGRQRSSGAQFLAHVLGTATTVAKWGMGPDMVAMALLHDVIDEQNTQHPMAPKDLRREFGADIAGVVEQFGQAAHVWETVQKHAARKEQAELLVDLTDQRVVLLKLASGLEKAQDLAKLRDEAKKNDRAQLLLVSYALVAGRLGMWTLKSELENHCLDVLFPTLADDIRKRQAELIDQYYPLLMAFRRELQERCRQAGLRIDVSCPERSICTLAENVRSLPAFRLTGRLAKDHLSLLQIVRFQALTPQKDDCYRILGIVHDLGKPIAGSLKDHIAVPKDNGYAALRTVVRYAAGDQATNLTINVRTWRMDELARNGITDAKAFAVWRAEAGIGGSAEPRPPLTEEDGERKCVDALVSSLLRRIKGERVRVFTPDGRPIDLARGATPLDFAYAVHSDLGHHYQSAQVNGRDAPVNYALQDGDVVEIRVDPNATPEPEWIGFVKSRRARQKLRQWLNRAPMHQGNHLLARELARHGLSWNDIPVQSGLEGLVKTDFGTMRRLLEDIGVGRVSAETVVQRLVDKSPNQPELRRIILRPEAEEQLGGEGYHIRLAKCCEPVYGTAILGCLNGRQITIHTEGCGVGRRAKKLLPLQWEDMDPEPLRVEIDMDGYDRPGLVRDVSAVMASRLINISDLTARTEPDGGRVKMRLVVELVNQAMPAELTSEISSVAGITHVHLAENPQLPLGDILKATPRQHPAVASINSRRVLGFLNPYSPGRPVMTRQMFFGRQRELSTIVGYVSPINQPTCLLLGAQRRRGKTSLAMRLTEEPRIKQEYLPVFVDLEYCASSNDYSVMQCITRRIQQQLGADGDGAGCRFNPFQSVRREENLYGRFEECLLGLHQRLQKRILLVLDEFQATLIAHHEGYLSSQFFSALRSWAQLAPLTLVVVGSAQLNAQITRTIPDFGTVFVSEPLGPLDRYDAQALIVRPVERFLFYEKRVTEAVQSLTGCFPYYIHLLCLMLVSRAMRDARSRITQVDLEALLPRLTQDPNSSYYSHLWDRDRPIQQTLLSILAAQEVDETDGWVDWDDLLVATAKQRSAKGLEDVVRDGIEGLLSLGTLGRRTDGRGQSFRIDLPLFRLWVRHNFA